MRSSLTSTLFFRRGRKRKLTTTESDRKKSSAENWGSSRTTTSFNWTPSGQRERRILPTSTARPKAASTCGKKRDLRKERSTKKGANRRTRIKIRMIPPRIPAALRIAPLTDVSLINPSLIIENREGTKQVG